MNVIVDLCLRPAISRHVLVLGANHVMHNGQTKVVNRRLWDGGFKWRWVATLAVSLAVLGTSDAEPAEGAPESQMVFADSPEQSIFDHYHDYYPDYDPSLTAPLSLNVEYVHWWLNGNSLPALVTTSPSGTPVNQAGVLGEPSTDNLFGEEPIDSGARSGFRASLGVRLGYYFDHLPDYELQLNYLLLGQESDEFAASSTGDPILARPYFDVQAGAPAADVITFPGQLEGQVRANASSDFYSAGALLKRHGWNSPTTRISFLFGYRYLRLKEDLLVDTANRTLAPSGPFPTGAEFEVEDSFSAWSEFNGADIGLDVQWHHGPWSWDFLAKLAVGNVHQKLDINGSTVVTEPQPVGDPIVSVADYGLLAMPSNIGRQSNNRLSFVPELGITLRRWCGRSFQMTIGYTVIAVTEVIRVADQIDTSIDFAQLTIPQVDARPQARLNDDILWMHGFRVGVDW